MITSSNHWSMGNNRGSMVSRGSMDNRGSMNNWGSMDNRGSIGRSGLNNWSIRVYSSSFIGNISNISIISISVVVHMLGTTIRKSNRVRSRDSSCTISSLFSIESSVGVVISNSISIGVRGRLIRVSWLSSVISRGNLDNRGSMHNWSSMHNWGSMVGRGGMDNWSSMNNWSMDSMDSMSNRSMHSMNSMSNRSVHSMSSNWDNSSMSNSNRLVSTDSRLDLSKTLRVIYLRHGGMGGSKSL